MSGNFNIRTVLVAPLDWGLGHATRCIPIIRALLETGYTVILAAEGAQAHLLRQEFPQLPCLPLSGYRVRYSRSRLMLPFMILRQTPRLLRCISREHRWLDEIIDRYKIDLVISDNRFGLYSDKVPSAFITHQLTIKAPLSWLQVLLRMINYRYINRFTECWVPDMEGGNNFAGVLSHPSRLPKIPVRYIGLLSRFYATPVTQQYDYCLLLSGPEPQRSLLEKKILAGLNSIEGKILLVRGKPGATDIPATSSNISVHNHLPTAQLQEAIMASGLVLSRSGYTTVMELVSLGKRCILVPTPGQTEQEYLAAYLQQKGVCFSVQQEYLNVAGHFKEAQQFSFVQGKTVFFKNDVLVQLLSSISERGY